MMSKAEEAMVPESAVTEAVAAERERVYAEIRQLATRHGATYPHSLIASGPLAGQGRTAPFADLIPGGETDG